MITQITLTGHQSVDGMPPSHDSISHHGIVNHQYDRDLRHMIVMASASYDLTNLSNLPIFLTVMVTPTKRSLKRIDQLNHGWRTLRDLDPWGGQLRPGNHGLHDLVNLVAEIWINM